MDASDAPRARAGTRTFTRYLATALLGAGIGAYLTYSLATSPEPASTKPPTAASAPTVADTAAATPATAEADLETAAGPPAQGEGTAVASLEKFATPPASSAATAPLDPVRPELPERIYKSVEIKRGDTLMDVMVKAGASRQEAHAAITALTVVFDPRRLRPGHQLNLIFEPPVDAAEEAPQAAKLISLAFDENVERQVLASLGPDGFVGQEIKHLLERRLNRAELTIEDSLYLAAERAGLPARVIIALIHLYSFDVDFQRDIQPGDTFELFYETFHSDDGGFARSGEILYASLRTGGTTLPLYRFEMNDGEIDYFNDKGHSVRKALMKTPIDGARLSSRFGRRKHPILGYTRMHKGIDFAAPTGTPVMAAGSGTVKFAGRKGGYGKYINIRHNSDYSTAYAHLSGYARGIRSGKRVRQGQIIGYVGSTGRSTGPHLHYEILRNGRQINPLGLKLPTGKKLKGEELAAFETERDRLAGLYQATPKVEDMAETEAQGSSE